MKRGWKRRAWECLRPQVPQIIYLIVGLLIGLCLTCYFEHRSDQNRRSALLRAAKVECDINMMPSRYAMYFDSIRFDQGGHPYPTLEQDALRSLRRDFWLLAQVMESEGQRVSCDSTFAEVAWELEDFNDRIELRNFSIINGTFSTRSNARAYDSYQRDVHPKLVGYRRLLDSLQQALD
jgi:hypothetical protein